MVLPSFWPEAPSRDPWLHAVVVRVVVRGADLISAFVVCAVQDLISVYMVCAVQDLISSLRGMCCAVQEKCALVRPLCVLPLCQPGRHVV
jgi:hypothetical protein